MTYDSYNGLANTQATCYPCAPGSWLTCTHKETCRWTIPDPPPGILNLGPDVQPLMDGPVNSCYPCAVAANTLHYSYANSPLQSFVDGSKEWMCPGSICT